MVTKPPVESGKTASSILGVCYFAKRKLKKPKIRKQMKSRVGICRKYKMFEVKLYDFT